MVSGPNEIWNAASIDMRKFSNDNKGYSYLLNVIDIFSKYAWNILLKTKTALEVTKAFESILSKNTLRSYGLIKVLNFIIKYLINN